MSKCYKHGGTVCPDCMDEEMARLIEPDCAPTLTTLEREVVEKAEKHRRGLRGLASLSQSERDLCDAVDALQSARKPAGVRPEEVAPGTWFVWAEKPDCKSAMVFGVRKKRYWGRDNGLLEPFTPEDRILPLDPQEPA